MAAPCWPAGALAAARSSRSATKGNLPSQVFRNVSVCCDRKISGEFMTKVRRFSGPLFAAFCLRNAEDGGPRIGFTIPRAVGKAVARNRIRRRVREAVRLQLERLNPQWSIVINPRRKALEALHRGDPARSGAALSPLQWILVRSLSVYKEWVSPLASVGLPFPSDVLGIYAGSRSNGTARRGEFGWGCAAWLRCHPFHEGGFDPVR